ESFVEPLRAQILERVEHEVSQGKLAVVAIVVGGNGHDRHPSGLGGQDTGGGVLQRETVAWRQRGGTRGGEKNGGVRLAVGLELRGVNRGESIQQLEVFEAPNDQRHRGRTRQRQWTAFARFVQRP